MQTTAVHRVAFAVILSRVTCLGVPCPKGPVALDNYLVQNLNCTIGARTFSNFEAEFGANMLLTSANIMVSVVDTA
jgi:hypothetical protein